MTESTAILGTTVTKTVTNTYIKESSHIWEESLSKT